MSAMSRNDLRQRRLKANIKLLHLLSELVHEYPHMRFGQILESFGYVKTDKQTIDEVGPFAHEYVWQRDIHLEPMDLLDRVQQEIQRVKAQEQLS